MVLHPEIDLFLQHLMKLMQATILKLFPRISMVWCSHYWQAKAGRGDLVVLTMVSTFGFGFNAFYLTPLINEKRDALLEPNASSGSFDLLHRLSVSIFMVSIDQLGLIILLK